MSDAGHPDRVNHDIDVDHFLRALVRKETRPYDEYAVQAFAATTALLGRLGNPQEGLRVIHVAGSKGKGSTALMIESILRASGATVGTFTSPHLLHWAERIRINGAPVANDALAFALATLRPVLPAQHGAESPGFFAVLTAAALLLFKTHHLEWVVLETGIGGLYDATNAATGLIACITSIEFEHTEKLGDTLSQIAHHKAGIIKPEAQLILGDIAPEAREAIYAQARRARASVRELGIAFHMQHLSAQGSQQSFAFRSNALQLRTTLAHSGHHMATNAALAIACAERALGNTPTIAHDIATGLINVDLPGRCQILRESPWIIVDGAHTQTSFDALAAFLHTLNPTRLHFVVSSSRSDANLPMLAEILKHGHDVSVTCADTTRSRPAVELADALKPLLPHVQVHVEPDPCIALRRAKDALRKDDALCVTGSMYMAGLGLKVLGGKSKRDGVLPTPTPRY